MKYRFDLEEPVERNDEAFQEIGKFIYRIERSKDEADVYIGDDVVAVILPFAVYQELVQDVEYADYVRPEWTHGRND